MSELLTIGKVWELSERRRHRRRRHPYDLVVLDGPATGEVLGLLGAPRTFAAIAHVGPVAQEATTIDRMLSDSDKTSVVAVCTLEQIAVSETLSLRAALADELGIAVRLVAVNRMISAGLSVEDRAALAAAGDDPAVRSARWLDARGRAQHTHLSRLRRGLAGVAITTLPFLFQEELDGGDVERLADLLEPSL